MSENKKNVPKLRFPEFDGEWEQYKLGEIYTERNEKGNDSLQILSVSIHSGVSSAELDEKSLGKSVRRSEDKTTYKHVYFGDLIFNMMRAWQGAIGVAKSEGMISPAYISAVPSEKVYPLFMDYASRRKEVIEQINNLSYGVTDFRKRLYWDSFIDVKCGLPSVDEQKKIWVFLYHLDDLITLHQRKLDSMKKYKSGMLQKMFPKEGETVPEVRFPGFTGEWERRKCEDILKPVKGAMKIGPFGSALKKEFYTTEGVKVYAQENIFQEDFSIGDYYISEERFQSLKGCKLEPGDLVVSMMGTIGACAIFPESAELGIMNSHLLRLQLREDIYPEYIHQLLRDSPQIRKQIDKLSVGSIMSGLSSSVVQRIVFPVPSLSEQKRIADFLTNLDKAITLHQRKLDAMKELKKGLLQQMFV